MLLYIYIYIYIFYLFFFEKALAGKNLRSRDSTEPVWRPREEVGGGVKPRLRDVYIYIYISISMHIPIPTIAWRARCTLVTKAKRPWSWAPLSFYNQSLKGRRRLAGFCLRNSIKTLSKPLKYIILIMKSNPGEMLHCSHSTSCLKAHIPFRPASWSQKDPLLSCNAMDFHQNPQI